MRKLPPQDVLLELLQYLPETGDMFWRERPSKYFKNAASVAPWNAKNAGKLALSADFNGYRGGSLLGRAHLSHRVIWKYMTGENPGTIDHIDGNRKNNKWSNLRSVTMLENNRNSQTYRNNTSGHVGVVYVKPTNRWRAQAKQDGKYRYFGTYDTLEEAVRARKAGAKKIGFHPNHGRPALAPLAEAQRND